MKIHNFSLVALIMATVLVLGACKKDEVCDTESVTYSGTIAPVISTKCSDASLGSCHEAGSANGDYTIYDSLNARIQSGAFRTRVITVGDMPDGDSLDACTLSQITTWLDAGAPNN